MNQKPSETLQWGDRVDHNRFGLGTVCEEPQGDKITVKWDDPNRKNSSVVSSFLRLVTRPDEKGGAFWHNEYVKLLGTVKSARAASDITLSRAFRPANGDGVTKLDQALAVEVEALEKLRAFLRQDENGEHR